MTRRRAAIALLMTCIALLTGCWDLREMNHLALVMAVGIDKSETPGRFEVTVQIARPAGRAGSGSSAAGVGRAVYVATADGDTIFGAIRNLAQFTSRRIMWAHNNVVIIGDALAREDITPVVDFFTRNQELRMRTWIAVARDAAARDVVATNTGMEDVPADSLSALLRYAQLPGESVRVEIGDVAGAFFATDANPVMPVIMLKPRALRSSDQPEEEEPTPQAVLSGSAIIRKTRLVGYVERETGRGLLWLRAQMKNAVLTIPCPEGKPGTLAVEIRSPKVKLRSSVGGQSPVMNVEVRTEAWLSEQGCPTPAMRASELKSYAAKALGEKIEAEMRATLKLLQQELKTDAIRYGRVLHIQHPDWWRKHGARWEEIFPKVKTRISVAATIPKMSLYTRPVRAHTP
ncbi:MAG TPA: Ger(x)C family spore germination protein [Symbiobacteriaceae bacterium]|nr:Ger(x)C family spore germination protein [Symbiobacteriaceae bacterium]